MDSYCAVFSDIDGTLLDSSHSLPVLTAQAVAALHADGVPFILVSARSPSGIFPIQRALGISGPIVCYGGALILDATGNPTHSLTMDMSQTIDIKRRIQATWPDVSATVYFHDNWFVDDIGDPCVVAEANITGAVPTEVHLETLGKKAQEAHKIFCVGSPDAVLEMERTLSNENPNLALIKSNPRYLEIMNKKATKTNALHYLCQNMRLSPAAVVTFGDNFNDLDMLESAGLGIAMGNAPSAVKTQADRVTADNNHEGVRLALSSLKFTFSTKNESARTP